MDSIRYIDRETGELCEETIYFGEMIRFLYGTSLLSRLFGTPLTCAISRLSIASALFGWWNQLPLTKKKILPFIERYRIDPSEFQDSIESYPSFNAFFTRKLKKEARPVAGGHKIVAAPADGRYLFYPNIGACNEFIIKGEKFNLKELLLDVKMAEEYQQGTLIIARLCPTDYHRYHWPIDCIPGKSKLINGPLYSVNPIALKKNPHILTRNKRMICTLRSTIFGEVLFIEVGATNVGSIHQTYTPDRAHSKGEEKGFFAFGASTLLLLFPPDSIKLDQDLLNASARHLEIRCLMGQRIAEKM